MKSLRITDYCHFIFKSFCESPELCIDATMGNGTDTLFLCDLVGEEGKVIAFDIQEKALENTKQRLLKSGFQERAELMQDSHENMDKYAEEETVDGIMFNFGYLPGGDHSVATQANSSIKAIETALKLLKKGGIVTLCIYSGGDSGFDEKNGILEYIRNLDSKEYIVITHEYFNRPNNPPLPVLIRKN